MATTYMSREELDELGEAIIKEYFRKHPNKAKSYVDVDDFISNYLGLQLQYFCFAEEEMGKLGFLADGKTPLMVYQFNRVISHILPKNTIAISTAITGDKEHNRCRFTKAHEASHFILARVNNEEYSARFYNDFDSQKIYGMQELSGMFNAGEWQANTLASAILMPRFLVEKTLDKHNQSRRVKCYGNYTLSIQDKKRIKAMANELNVSFSAFLIRLKDLRLLEYHDMSEYIEDELYIGG